MWVWPRGETVFSLESQMSVRSSGLWLDFLSWSVRAFLVLIFPRKQPWRSPDLIHPSPAPAHLRSPSSQARTSPLLSPLPSARHFPRISYRTCTDQLPLERVFINCQPRKNWPLEMANAHYPKSCFTFPIIEVPDVEKKILPTGICVCQHPSITVQPTEKQATHPPQQLRPQPAKHLSSHTATAFGHCTKFHSPASICLAATIPH
ncbi:uncharacterized protein B0T23DRAFT_378540 [Neurospora hispaniola]|uniref:Uncharacterized protein n=1 Tax=Neurospora hispaniola TaxID=588809 RepID=A0AAJ0MSY5_9PEZI|nr:hypothetical protein B0T23DRAFT_378540 [Neurospora hispaniola]